ncbi:PH domain-containing protein [Pseudoalteromonas sp. OFAV1]|uniref:PH domain-containing protein n=1 Tax=Pseudoalteromonas sp. OFAV1 TaxID=2908892 RepID=UPI001F3BA590|nr:PH domain-containing protein [Pseudoalteromonas sp. OFAV1]MCF2901787.1 PH domain-containing protein [Pseudoalteromonas sp. OFAV1]
MFSNQQIETLPKHQTIQFQPLAENAIWQVQINWLLFYIPLMVTIIVVRHLNQGLTEAVAAPWLAILPVLVVISLSYNYFSVRAKGVAVREHDIAFKRGLIWQQVTLLPISRVQHTEIHRGPIERKLGLATLRLYSAGGMSADLHISGLTDEQCNDVRQFVQGYGDITSAQDNEFADE